MNLIFFKSSLLFLSIVTTATVTVLLARSKHKTPARVCEESDDPVLFI